jgi:RNA polymerase sigma factor (sigma-70 family)
VRDEARTNVDLSLLLQRIAAGDESALGTLLQCRWSRLVHYASGFTGDVHDAEDAVQEALVRLWDGRERWTRDGCVSPALLYRIVRNVAIDTRRSRHPRSRTFLALSTDLEYKGPLPDEHAMQQELQLRLREALRTLPARRREIFDLARFQGLTYQEIAEVLGLSPQTVANQVSAAFRSLREVLHAYR